MCDAFQNTSFIYEVARINERHHIIFIHNFLIRSHLVRACMAPYKCGTGSGFDHRRNEVGGRRSWHSFYGRKGNLFGNIRYLAQCQYDHRFAGQNRAME